MITIHESTIHDREMDGHFFRRPSTANRRRGGSELPWSVSAVGRQDEIRRQEEQEEEEEQRREITNLRKVTVRRA